MEETIAALPHDAHPMGTILTGLCALSTLHPEQVRCIMQQQEPAWQAGRQTGLRLQPLTQGTVPRCLALAPTRPQCSPSCPHRFRPPARPPARHPPQNPALAGQNIYQSKEVQDKQVVRLIGKIPTLAALAYHRASGRKPAQPNQNLGYAEASACWWWLWCLCSRLQR